nr:MAG TPA: hypothetical protein [Caudoviricetes sp.]
MPRESCSNFEQQKGGLLVLKTSRKKNRRC